MPARRDAALRIAFRLSLVFKGIFSVLEIAAGVLAYFVSADAFVRLVVMLTQDELSEDPRDFVAGHLLTAANGLSIGSRHFAALYLLSHGAIKTFLVAGLLRERIWYYPVAIVAFAAFVAYQVLRFSHTHSAWVLVLTIVDLIVIALTWNEYRCLRGRARTL